jgi:hypothetical protein
VSHCEWQCDVENKNGDFPTILKERAKGLGVLSHSVPSSMHQWLSADMGNINRGSLKNHSAKPLELRLQ